MSKFDIVKDAAKAVIAKAGPKIATAKTVGKYVAKSGSRFGKAASMAAKSGISLTDQPGRAAKYGAKAGAVANKAIGLGKRYGKKAAGVAGVVGASTAASLAANKVSRRNKNG